MEQSTILFVCLSALIAIFVILPSLALVMHFIVLIFPKEESIKTIAVSPETDLAVYAAISTTYKTLYPGTKIKEIVENK